MSKPILDIDDILNSFNSLTLRPSVQNIKDNSIKYIIEETINSIQDFIYNKVMKGDDYDELEEALDKEFLMIQTNKLYKEVIKYQDPYLYKVYEDFVQLINYYF
jgi:hypothetical protein